MRHSDTKLLSHTGAFQLHITACVCGTQKPCLRCCLTLSFLAVSLSQSLVLCVAQSSPMNDAEDQAQDLPSCKQGRPVHDTAR